MFFLFSFDYAQQKDSITLLRTIQGCLKMDKGRVRRGVWQVVVTYANQVERSLSLSPDRYPDYRRFPIDSKVMFIRKGFHYLWTDR